MSKRIVSIYLCLAVLAMVSSAYCDTNVLYCLIGSDLEQQSGAASADIKEILRTVIPSDVHVFVMAGGTRDWQLTDER